MSEQAAARRLFAYGTLMWPEILHALIGPLATPRPATLADYARYRLRQRVFPGIVPEASASTDGVVFEGMTAARWRRLDAWESSLYERLAVSVTLPDGSTCRACTYVVSPAQRHRLSKHAWSVAQFTRLHLAEYRARFAPAAP